MSETESLSIDEEVRAFLGLFQSAKYKKTEETQHIIYFYKDYAFEVIGRFTDPKINIQHFSWGNHIGTKVLSTNSLIRLTGIIIQTVSLITINKAYYNQHFFTDLSIHHDKFFLNNHGYMSWEKFTLEEIVDICFEAAEKLSKTEIFE